MTISQITDGGSGKISNIELEPGETVLHDLRPSIVSWPLVIVFGWLVFPIVYSWWRYRQTRYVVTTDRVIIKRNRPTKETIKVSHQDISQVRATKRGMEAFSKYGTIQLDTVSEGEVVIRAVPNHIEVANTISEQISK